MVRISHKHWDVYVAVVTASAMAYFLPADAAKDITTELIAFFSIQSAVILPAMIFTASILKPDGLEISDAERYHKALRMQMHFWIVLLSFDFAAVSALILNKATNWNLHITIPIWEHPIILNKIFPWILYFSGLLAVFRTIPFVKGVLSLLDLNSDLAQKAIKRRNKMEREKRNLKKEKINIPEGYGTEIKRPD